MFIWTSCLFGVKKDHALYWPDFNAKQITEKVAEERRHAVVDIIEICKPSDCIHRPALWEILEQYAILAKVIKIIQKLYKETNKVVSSVNRDTSIW